MTKGCKEVDKVIIVISNRRQESTETNILSMNNATAKTILRKNKKCVATGKLLDN
jgi:hypothetical protein